MTVYASTFQFEINKNLKRLQIIKPRTEVSDLKLTLINDTRWSLHAQKKSAFTIMVFYRAMHPFIGST